PSPGVSGRSGFGGGDAARWRWRGAGRFDRRVPGHPADEGRVAPSSKSSRRMATRRWGLRGGGSFLDGRREPPRESADLEGPSWEGTPSNPEQPRGPPSPPRGEVGEL